MITSSHACAGNLALIVLFSALSACQTVSAPEPATTPAPIAAAIDEATGAGKYYPQVSSYETPEIRFGQMPALVRKNDSSLLTR